MIFKLDAFCVHGSCNIAASHVVTHLTPAVTWFEAMNLRIFLFLRKTTTKPPKQTWLIRHIWPNNLGQIQEIADRSRAKQKNTCASGNPTLPKFTGETRIFFSFSGKKYNFTHFERRNAFQNANNYIFSQEKNNLKIYVCLPYLKLSDPLSETHLFFYLA